VAVRVDPREDYRETILAGQESVLVVPARPAAPARRSRPGQDTTLAYTILTPTFAVILGMVAYPFFIGIWLSLQSKMVGAPGRFVGLQNYVELFRNDLFLRTVYNSVVYTVVAVAIKFVLGLTMALVLDQERRFNNFFRTLLFVPWALPVVIVSLSWRWIFDDLSGFLNNFLITFHITNHATITHNFRIRVGTAGTVLARSVNLGPGRSTNITVKLSARSYTIFCGIHPSLMHTSFRAT